jgi:hypothetical protein
VNDGFGPSGAPSARNERGPARSRPWKQRCLPRFGQSPWASVSIYLEPLPVTAARDRHRARARAAFCAAVDRVAAVRRAGATPSQRRGCRLGVAPARQRWGSADRFGRGVPTGFRSQNCDRSAAPSGH